MNATAGNAIGGNAMARLSAYFIVAVVFLTIGSVVGNLLPLP